MSSHKSSSCLLAVIAIFVIAMAMSGTHSVSPPAKIAGHNSNSTIALKKVVGGAGSKITDLSTIATVAPYLHISNETSYDGANHAPKNDSNNDNVPVVNGTLTKVAWYRRTVLVLSISSCILMVITAFVSHFSESCEHSRHAKNLMMGVALYHYITLFTDAIKPPTFTDFKSTGIYKLLIIINSNWWQLKNNLELYKILKFMNDVSKFKREISKGTTFHKICWFFQIISTIYCCIDIFHQVYDESTKMLYNPKILGIQIKIKLSILTELIPGLVNIMAYIYFFKYNEIPITSIHPELLSFYEKRISTRNQMFKLSVLMFTVDILYVLDNTMEWNFNAIQILHLLKSAQGIFIFYVIIVRPYATVLYSKLLKCLRPRKGSANEETLEVTANPMYTITQLITTV